LANIRDRAKDVAPNGIFVVKQLTGIIEIYINPTPFAMVTKIWEF